MAAPKRTPLSVRKLADMTDGERVARWHPDTGEKYLADPVTGEAKPWPFAGLEIVGDPPRRTRVSTNFVNRGRAEGWIGIEGERVVHRPGGPPEDPWRETHTFVHCDQLILRCVGGDVRYRVTGNPDKWPERKQGDLGFGGEVRWYYDLELVPSGGGG